jgi:HAD superfamily hydrolase (TIGR01549 family)
MGDDTAAVLFDLDDTLCRYPRSTDELLADAFDRTGVDPFFTAAEFRAWIPKVTGTSALDLREKCFRGIAAEMGLSEDVAERVAANYPERDPTDVAFLPGAERALETLSERYSLGLVSNGAPHTQRRKLETLGIEGHFEEVAFGTPEIGIKPDPAPFHRVLDGLDIAPGRAVHVGNSLESDVAGANAAGVPAVWLRLDGAPADDITPEYVIDGLAELHHEPHPWTDA